MLPNKDNASLKFPGAYPAGIQHTPPKNNENTKVGFRPQ